MRADTGKRWTCLTCGRSIRRRHIGTSIPTSELGRPFYTHVDPALDAHHGAVRRPR